MNVTVDLSDGSSTGWTPSSDAIQQWSRIALECAGQTEDAELSLRLVDENEGRQLNREYRGKDYATNVLSFPMQLPDELGLESGAPLSFLGDIVICPQVVNDEAEQQDKPAVNHWAHLIIHGTLHLLGYEHENEAGAEQMEGLEIKALQILGIPNPYLIG